MHQPPVALDEGARLLVHTGSTIFSACLARALALSLT